MGRGPGTGAARSGGAHGLGAHGLGADASIEGGVHESGVGHGARGAGGADDERPEHDDGQSEAPDDDRFLRERPPHWG